MRSSKSLSSSLPRRFSHHSTPPSGVRRSAVVRPFRHLINSLGLSGLEPAVVEGAGVFFRDFDV